MRGGNGAEETDLEKVQIALARIIGHVDKNRPRGWHIYPTHLRDQAVRALEETGYPVKTYEEYERMTDRDFEAKGLFK